MPKRIPFSKSPGSNLVLPVTSSERTSCNWCSLGERPDSNGICPACVQFFKRLLCSTKWRKLRLSLLSASPYCVLCYPDKLEIADTIDHVRPWRFFPDLFWDEDNLRTLSKVCHDRLTQVDQRNPLDLE